MKKNMTAKGLETLNIYRSAKIEKLNTSDSNKKLVPSTMDQIKADYESSIAFMIWNIPCRITCPYATKACKEFCYADKAELAYPDCKPSRIRNFENSRKADFIDRAVYSILSKLYGMRAKKLVVRIHESGDFYNKTYTKAWLEIIRRIESYGFTREQVIFIAYTKSFPFFDGEKLPELLSLRASLDKTSLPWLIDIVKRNNWKIYRVVEKFSDSENENNCRCSDCATCGKCWSDIQEIECEIH